MNEPQQSRPRAVSQAELLGLLAAGATVATGNARLARSLSEAWERTMVEQGRVAWATPEVLPLTAWMQDCFEEAAMRSVEPPPRLLKPEQEAQLWAEVIAEDAAARSDPLLRLDATARRARQSYELLRAYELDVDDRRFCLNENPAAFRRWAAAFEARCRARGEAPMADLPALLQPLLSGGLCDVPEQLVLAGFYELTPALVSLVESVVGTGCRVEWLEPEGAEGEVFRLRADDPRDEVARATDWARGILERWPDARIGVVVPDLQARRAQMDSAMRRRLDPASMVPGAVAGPQPWNLSLGLPLSAYPVVATALRLLALMRPVPDLELWGLLLLSPHWALPADAHERRAELERRALLDRRIRSIGDARLSLESLRYHAGGGGGDGEREVRPWHSELLVRSLERLRAAAARLPDRAGATVWAAAFTAWLRAAGWGAYGEGGRPLDSHEYQAVEAWHDLLSRLGGLDDYAGALGPDEALALLERLAAETLFQPRTGDAAVQVLGLYEAIGQSFDHLWVMGLHDGAWPPAPGPDPFIPTALQRERRLPHSGPEVELEWARQVTAQLRSAAPKVRFSFPARDGDQELQCSPLLEDLPWLPENEAEVMPAVDDWSGRIGASGQAESMPADAPLPFPEAPVRGGSRLLADQAACPFRAFATHRLGAEPLERPQPGLDAMRRGTLAHRVLAAFWSELETQAALLALDEPALRERLRHHIGEVLESERRRSPATYSPRLRAVEAARLEERVMAWLELERQRSPFRVVGRETESHFDIGGLGLRLVVDRIDEVADGSRVVLDYKTGKVTPSAWFGERPEEPQLPLYGVAVRQAGEPGGDVAGVAFAQILPERVAFSGVVREPDLLPGLPGKRKGPITEAAEHWPAVLDEWAQKLERLALDFRAGGAEVDPKRGLATCDRCYCELGPLCRVRELLPLAEAEGAEGDVETEDDC